MDDFEEQVRRILAVLEKKSERFVPKLPWQPWMDDFLRDLERHRGNVWKAAQLCPVDRSTIYRHKRRNPEFSARWDAILEKLGQRRCYSLPV